MIPLPFVRVLTHGTTRRRRAGDPYDTPVLLEADDDEPELKKLPPDD